MIHDKLKKIIFNKLYKDLSKAEIIDFNDSIWFIDRENKYWYFEYEKVGRLYWRYDFFLNFFSVFSLERDEFESIMSEWIEEVLNCKVDTNSDGLNYHQLMVKDVLNCNVNKTTANYGVSTEWVEEVLDCKVDTIIVAGCIPISKVEEVLDCKVDTIQPHKLYRERTVEDMLNITLIRGQNLRNVDEVLDYNVTRTASTEGHQIGKVNQVLNQSNMDFDDDISDWDCTLMDGLEDE